METNIEYLTENKEKIANVIKLGIESKRRIKDLNGVFKETLDAVSKELKIDKKEINNAIRLALKAEEEGDKERVMEEEQEKLDLTRILLDVGTK